MKIRSLSIAGALLLAACGSDSSNAADPAPRLQSDDTQAAATQLAAPQASAPTAESKPTTETQMAEAAASPGYETSIILSNPDGINELIWEDLMPIGEEDVLTQMYEEYFANLSKDMEARSQRLLDVRNGEDGNADLDIAEIAEGSAADTMKQIGTFNVVDDLDGLKIRLPGYVVPLDFSANGQYDEFLLVPYFGACLHTPPPPPNQIVYVKASPAAEVKSIYEPVWVEGTMKTGKFESDTGDSAYELTLSKIEAYEY